MHWLRLAKSYSTNTSLQTLLLAAVVGSGAFAWDFDRAYTMPEMPVLGQTGRSDTAFYFEPEASGSPKRYARTFIAVREGGFGALLRDDTDPTGSSFWLLNDRGFATNYETSSLQAKVFPFPNYHQKLTRLRIEGDRLVVVSIDSIASLESMGTFTVGLPSSKVAVDETALIGRLDAAVVDESAQLASVPNGYDFEALRRLPTGDFLASDEFGPFFVEIDALTKRIVREWYPGNGLPRVFANRRDNHGFEAMAVTASGKVVAALQSPACNPKSSTKSSRAIRVLWFDPADGASREYVYLSDLKGASRRDGSEVKLGDMVALSESRFLVIEHGKDAFDKYWIDIVEFDISQATDIHDPSDRSKGKTYTGGLTPEEIGLDSSSAVWKTAGIVPVAKTVRMPDLLAKAGAWTSQKPEGMELLGDSALVLLNDNDYGASDKNSDGIAHVLPESERTEAIVYLRMPAGAGDGVRTAHRGARFSARRVGQKLMVSLAAIPQASLRLLDLSGREKATGIANGGEGVVDLAGIGPGMFVLQCTTTTQRFTVPVMVSR